MENSWPTLQLDQIGKTLSATLGDLRSLYARVHYAETGRLPEGVSRDDLVGEVKLEQGDISEEELFMGGLNGIYLDLDYAWTTRFIDIEAAQTVAERVGWISFHITTPTCGAFASLVPDAIPDRGESFNFTNKPVSLTPVRVALQSASEKLTSLVCRIAKLPEEKIIEADKKGNETCVRTQIVPPDENDFAKRLSKVYAYVNMAWNSRFNETPVSAPDDVKSRCMFPSNVLRKRNLQ